MSRAASETTEDQTVPVAGSGKRTHETLPDSRLHLIAGGPHGVNVSHTDEFNEVLLAFLGDDPARSRVSSSDHTVVDD
jgi:hypothetical protein